jgi:hypothetical protein
MDWMRPLPLFNPYKTPISNPLGNGIIMGTRENIVGKNGKSGD